MVPNDKGNSLMGRSRLMSVSQRAAVNVASACSLRPVFPGGGGRGARDPAEELGTLPSEGGTREARKRTFPKSRWLARGQPQRVPMTVPRQSSRVRWWRSSCCTSVWDRRHVEAQASSRQARGRGRLERGVKPGDLRRLYLGTFRLVSGKDTFSEFFGGKGFVC